MGDSEGFNKYKNGDENAKKLYHHAAFQVDSDKNAPSHDDTPVTVDDTITANAAFQVDSDENAAHDDTPVTVDDTITALEVENDKIKAQLPTTPLPDDTITAADWQQKDKTVANMNLPWKFDRANLGKEFYGFAEKGVKPLDDAGQALAGSLIHEATHQPEMIMTGDYVIKNKIQVIRVDDDKSNPTKIITGYMSNLSMYKTEEVKAERKYRDIKSKAPNVMHDHVESYAS